MSLPAVGAVASVHMILGLDADGWLRAADVLMRRGLVREARVARQMASECDRKRVRA